MRKHINYLSALILLSLAVVSFRSKAQTSGPTNFSGTWVINLDKSQFNNAPHYTASKQITVSQTAENLKLSLVQESDAGADSIANETLPLNGSPFEIVGGDKKSRKITAQITDAGKTLTINTDVSVPNDPNTEQYNSAEAWNLAADGQTLTVKKSVKATSGFAYTITAVYQKK